MGLPQRGCAKRLRCLHGHERRPIRSRNDDIGRRHLLDRVGDGESRDRTISATHYLGDDLSVEMFAREGSRCVMHADDGCFGWNRTEPVTNGLTSRLSTGDPTFARHVFRWNNHDHSITDRPCGFN